MCAIARFVQATRRDENQVSHRNIALAHACIIIINAISVCLQFLRVNVTNGVCMLSIVVKSTLIQ